MKVSKIIEEKVPHMVKKEFSIVSKKLAIYDTETTGIAEDDRIVQLGGLISNGINPKKFDTVDELTYTEKRLSSMAIATTNILPEMLEGKKVFSENEKIQDFVEKMKKSNVIAHNINFDNKMMQKEGIFFDKNQCIDTLRVARHLLGPEHCTNDEKIESHQLQYLRYELQLYKNEPSYEKNYGITLSAHDAFSDVVFLRELFIYLFNLLEGTFENRIKELILLTQTPVFKDEIPWGKVFPKGTPLSEIVDTTYEQYGKTKQGIDYLEWFLTTLKNADQYYSFKRVILEKKMSNLYKTYSALSNKKDLFLSNKDKENILLASIFIPMNKNKRKFLDIIYLDSIKDKIQTKIIEYFSNTIENINNSDESDDDKNQKIEMFKELKSMLI